MKNKYLMGYPHTIIYLEMRNGTVMECLIDTDDIEKVWGYSWHPQKAGNYYYVVARVSKQQNKRIMMHKLLMDSDKDEIIDHINRNALDNRRLNLRIVNKRDNARNQSIYNDKKPSGYKNVRYVEKRKSWVVVFTQNKKDLYRGYFKNKDDAIAEAAKMRKTLFDSYSGEHKELSKV